MNETNEEIISRKMKYFQKKPDYYKLTELKLLTSDSQKIREGTFLNYDFKIKGTIHDELYKMLIDKKIKSISEKKRVPTEIIIEDIDIEDDEISEEAVNVDEIIGPVEKIEKFEIEIEDEYSIYEESDDSGEFSS